MYIHSHYFWIANLELSLHVHIGYCSVESGSCSALSVDDRPPQVTVGMEPETEGLPGELRSNQWLGASVSSNVLGTIAVCAPRYVNYGPRATKREPTGDCFVSADGGLNFTRVSPCTDDFTTFYQRTFIDPASDMGFVSHLMVWSNCCVQMMAASLLILYYYN